MAAAPQLSGAIFLNSLAVYREIVGDAVVAQAIEAIPPESRAIVESTVPVAWVDTSIVDQTYQGIADLAGRELEPLYREVVYEGVSRTLKTVWRVLLRLHTDKALVARTPAIYARGHSMGAIETRVLGPGEAEIVLTGWPGIPHLRRVGVAMGIQAVLNLAGREQAEVTHKPTPEGARFRATW